MNGSATGGRPGSPRRRGRIAPGRGWSEERLFFDGAEYFTAVEEAIAGARRSVDLEMYMFEPDVVGHRIAAALLEARRRGVRVRVLVDGAGSLRWRRAFGKEFRRAQIPFRVYHELPWDRLLRRREVGPARVTLRDMVDQINRRDHRKLIIVDSEVAFVGSHNICDPQCAGVDDEPAWRDTSVSLRGDPVEELGESFGLVFSRRPFRRRLLGRRRHHTERGELTLVHTNLTRPMRGRARSEFIARLDGARERIWFTTGYFVPRPRLMQALARAAQRRVDVRLLVPLRSDIPFIPWVSTAFYRSALRAGARIWEYLPTILHAKTMIVDDWFSVGTTNLNHRSFIHDLELDVVITGSGATRELAGRFVRDLEVSHPVVSEAGSRHGPLRRLVGRVLLSLRYWL